MFPTPTPFTTTLPVIEFGLVCTDVQTMSRGFILAANAHNILNIVLLIAFVLAAVRWLLGRMSRRAVGEN